MSTDSKRVPLEFRAGINRENTSYTTGGHWYNGNRVRFRSGKPENIRGWQRKVTEQYNGIARAITSWASLSGNLYAAFGTDQLLYVYAGGSIYDITPVNTSVTTSSTAPVIYSSTGSSKLIVDWVSQSPDLNAIGLSQNTFIIVSAGTDTVGGVSITGEFRTSIPADLSAGRYFKIIASSEAGSNATRTSATNFTFLLNAGSQTQVAATGYGTARYGMDRVSAYGTPATVGSGFAVLPRSWTFSHWGEDLIACPRRGSIYLWDEDTGTAQRATAITSSCPTDNTLALVSPVARHLVACGTMPLTSVFDPMLIRWSSSDDYNDWLPTDVNTAGEQRITDGSKIITAVNARNQTVVLTDSSMYTMSYVGDPYIFQVDHKGGNCGAIGLHCAVEADGRVFWMSHKSFFMYDGALRHLPCTIEEYIFKNMNEEYFDKVYAGFNTEFTEITWLYPSSESTECDKYVTYNPGENWWAYGEAKWTAWEDKKLYDTILTTGTDSYLFDNEPKNIYTGEGQAIESFVESGSFDLDKATFGNNLVFIDRVIPDFKFENSGNIDLTISLRKYPQSETTTDKGPFTITGTTTKVHTRGRGREASLKIERGATANTKWRLGSISMDMVEDGQR